MKNRKTLKQLILGSLLLLSTNSLFAQTQKVHTLQAKNTSTSTTMNSDALIQMDSDNKGLLLPRIALTGANQVAPLTAHTAGMVVYNTATVAATATIEAVTPGYYYNNGTKWVKIANTDTADITDDAWKNNTTTNVVELATKADGTTRTAGSEVRIDDNGTIFAGPNTFDSLGLPAGSSSRNSYFYASGESKFPGWQSEYNFKKYGYLDISSYNNTRAGNGRLQLFRSRGTIIAAQAVQNQDILGQIVFGGERGAGSTDESNANFITSQLDGTVVAGKHLPSKLGFWTANDDLTELVERMIIRSSGNVGIGTPTPEARLHVQTADEKVAQFYYGGHISTPRLYINGSANKISLKTAYNTGGADLALGTVDNNESILIKEAGNLLLNKDKGNVGIGTTTPTAKLNVKGSTLLNGYAYIIRDDASPFSNMLDIKRKTTPSGSTAEHPYINFAHQIAGESYVRGTGGIKSGQSNSKGVITIQSYISNQYVPGSTFSQDFTNSYTLINPYGGNVGIGTGTPTQKLDVVGNVKATSFISATTTYPDYVFEKYYKGFSKLNNEYNFKALPEVEAFIKANGHLPGYKPANEIIEAGSFNVTESHLMNVEKIEELYLHTIEQDKKLKAQQQQIEKLEALVTKLIETKK